MSSWWCEELGSSPFIDVFAAVSHVLIYSSLNIVWSESFFIFHKLIQVIFPSLGWTQQGVSPFQFLLGFDPICVVCHHFFICFSRASFRCTRSNLLIHLLGLMCSLSCPRTRCCCLGHIHRLSCLLEHLHSFRHFECRFHLGLLCLSSCSFSLSHDDTMHSALGSAEHFSCSSVVVNVPAPYVVVCVTTASKTCNLCRSKFDWDVSIVDVWRTRTRHIGSCASLRWYLDP